MKEYKFGTIPKKTIQIEDNGDAVFVSMFGNAEYNAEELKAVYVTPATMAMGGTVYFAFNTDTLPENASLEKTGFAYTKGQQAKLDELLELFGEFNPDFEVEGGNPIFPTKTTKKKHPKNAVVCPNCNSINVQFMQNNKKGFSVGKAVVGGMLTSGVGAIAGFAGKKGKNQFHCQDCGNVFEKKR